MIKVDQNTPHHVEGRKLGKETEQLDILKNKYVRKQTNHKYGKKKFVSVCIKSKLEASNYRHGQFVRTDSVFFFLNFIFIFRHHSSHKSICSDWPVCVTFWLDIFQDL